MKALRAMPRAALPIASHSMIPGGSIPSLPAKRSPGSAVCPKKEKFSLEHSFGAVSRYMIDTCFYSLNTLRVDVPVPPEWTASRPMPLTVTVTNTQHDSLHLPDSYPFGIAWSLKSDKQVVDTLMMQPITQLHWGPAESQTYEVQVDRWPDPGTYVARVSLQKAWFYRPSMEISINSR